MFKFRITAQNVWIVYTRVNGIFPVLLNRNLNLSLTPESKIERKITIRELKKGW